MSSRFALGVGLSSLLALSLCAATASADPGDAPGPAPGVTAPTGINGDSGPTPEQDKKEGAEEQKLIFRGSSLLLDQSVTPETIGIGKDYQSADPSYQWWISFRPRVYVFESKDQKHSININGRFDFYKEFTNSDETTKYRENQIGDSYVNATYSFKAYDQRGWTTTIGGGPRFLLPTSTASRNAGMIMSAGGGLFANQDFPLNRGGNWFQSMHAGVIGYYTHAFTNDTTGNFTDSAQARTGTDGRTFQDTQLSGGFLVNHQILSIVDVGAQITSKLSFTFDWIMIHQWRYDPKSQCGTDGSFVATQTGQVCAQNSTANAAPPHLRVLAFPLASFDYQLVDELALSLGYYTYANLIGPDGQYRNPFYSPNNSRFFLTATISLDALYLRARGKKGQDGNGRLSSTMPNIMTF